MRLVAPSLLLLLAACGAAPRDDAAGGDETPPPAAKTRRPGKALVETVEGVRVVHLSGSPEEMGEQMGTLLGEDLRYLLDANLKKTPYVARDPKLAVEKARRFAAGIPDSQMRELRATAKAAGVEEDWMLVAATIIEIAEDSRACAAVGAWGDATASHETIIGRNLDWFNLGKLNERGLLIVRHPDEGRATVSCGFAGLPGVLSGMNDAGVFTADLVQYAFGRPAPKEKGVPVMSLQRLALETSGTAEEVLRVYETSLRTVPQNYVVGDKTAAAFVECDAGSFVRREPCGQTVAGTNWAEEARGAKPKGDARFGNMCGCIDPAVGKIGVPEIQAALAAANAGPLSIMSVVAVPARRRLAVSIGKIPACKGPFVDIDAGALLDKDPR
jgi:hypothetical protein